MDPKLAKQIGAVIDQKIEAAFDQGYKEATLRFAPDVEYWKTEALENKNRFLKGITSLTSVTLPASLTSIGQYAFTGRSSLTSVTVNSPDPPSLGRGVFKRCSNNLQIKVPKKAVGAYQSASGWE